VVVLAQPPASVKVPPGRYHPYRVWLKQGKAEAYLNYGVPQSGKANVVEEISGSQMPVLGPPPPEQAVVVDEGRTAVLAVGGPLTNCVSATHRGRNLLLELPIDRRRWWRLLAGGGGRQEGAASYHRQSRGRRIGIGAV
jgi:phenylpyruvate tautomerase PptA (4-oxalocrotonate tautomerase family)